MDASYMCGLYVDDNLPFLIALGKVYEGSTIVHHIPLGIDMVKVPKGPTKPVDRPKPDGNPIYQMTLMIL
ncbi:hypothetical protein GmHk_06G016032 [Glycine max]|nr:hypothetical protein GmHk_06G016032 [Glycine max]